MEEQPLLIGHRLAAGLVVVLVDLPHRFQNMRALCGEGVGHRHKAASAMRVAVGHVCGGGGRFVAAESVAHLDRSGQVGGSSIQQGLQVLAGVLSTAEEQGEGSFLPFGNDAGGEDAGSLLGGGC